NAGKTTIFNQLTGANQHVGNWPGKTVACEQGRYTYEAETFDVIDLPGTYSLAAYSGEENAARSYLLENPPDLVLVVLDATNLERHLYLAVQLLETGIPAILALNMSDLADKRGQRIDPDLLSKQLCGVPVQKVIAKKGVGIQALRRAIWEEVALHACNGHRSNGSLQLAYAEVVERELARIESRLGRASGVPAQFQLRWLALELLTDGRCPLDGLSAGEGTAALREAISGGRERLRAALPDGVEFHVADVRFEKVGRISETVLDGADAPSDSISDRIDHIVTHPVFGVPIFLGVMYLIFRLVVNVSAPYLDWIDAVVSGPLTAWSAAALTTMSAPAWLQALIVEGVIAGVGGVLVFLPGLIGLFIFIAVLEDSGYLARAAFVMNRFLTFLGLNGRSFVPLILGFGCAVPAIYATRTLESRRDRLLTALMVPLMSCSARLPVYVLFSMALFGRRADQVIWGLYALGVTVAIGAGWVFSRTLLRSERAHNFIMELPRYRLPTLSSLWGHVSRRVRDFIEGAGTVILLASVAVWVLLHIPLGVNSIEESAFGRASQVIAPVFKPAGFGTWEASASLMSGLVAKEVVVSTMSEIYIGSPLDAMDTDASFPDQLVGIGTGFVSATIDAGREVIETLTPGIVIFPSDLAEPARQTALSGVLTRVFTPAAGLAFLVYVLLYIPCIATLSVIRSEFGLSWALFSALYQTALAWVAATSVYQLAMLVS
ncbi:MAG: ferrous iron transport protein B, partial [Anaerolineales bacterium]